MESVVAVEMVVWSEHHYFLTWGRVFDPPDSQVLAVVTSQLAQFGVNTPVETSRVCASLQEAAKAPYFFEGLVDFCQHPIPYGEGYDTWRANMRAEMENGHGVYYLGIIPSETVPGA